jgi:hypothetical protein
MPFHDPLPLSSPLSPSCHAIHSAPLPYHDWNGNRPLTSFHKPHSDPLSKTNHSCDQSEYKCSRTPQTMRSSAGIHPATTPPSVRLYSLPAWDSSVLNSCGCRCCPWPPCSHCILRSRRWIDGLAFACLFPSVTIHFVSLENLKLIGSTVIEIDILQEK